MICSTGCCQLSEQRLAHNLLRCKALRQRLRRALHPCIRNSNLTEQRKDGAGSEGIEKMVTKFYLLDICEKRKRSMIGMSKQP